MDNDDRVSASRSKSRRGLFGMLKSVLPIVGNGSNASGAEETIAHPTEFPDEKLDRYYSMVETMATAYYGYKATRNGILRLIIPRGAEVAIPRKAKQRGRYTKLRANSVYVDKIVPVAGGYVGQAGIDNDRRMIMSKQSIHNSEYIYTEGEFHRPDLFDSHPDHGCSNGLHFFPTIADAKAWFKTNNPAGSVIKDGLVTAAANWVRPE